MGRASPQSGELTLPADRILGAIRPGIPRSPARGADQVTVPPSGVQAAEGEGSFQGRTTIPPC